MQSSFFPIVPRQQPQPAPEGWEWVPLSQLCHTITGGGTPDRDRAELFGGDIVWITPSDIKLGEPTQEIFESRTTLTELGMARSSAKRLPVGAVLFSSRATIGKIAIAGIPLCTNQGFINFVCNPSLDNRYLAWSLYFFTDEIKKLAGSTTYQEVNRSSLRDFSILVPYANNVEFSIVVQRRIVARIESLIADVKDSKKILDDMRRDVYLLLPSAYDEVLNQVKEKSPVINLVVDHSDYDG